MLAQINRNDILTLAQIVREETGNQVQEKNFSMLESRIRTRILKLGLSSIESYWEYFRRNEGAEREVLQSLMTTHYTFFFREFAHFEAVGDWVEAELPRLKERYSATRQPVRVWSAACSRGQEVYSLAMFLEHALLNRHGLPFEILGTDIDAESVAFADNGVYSIKEVNTIPQSYLGRNWKRGTGPVKDFAAVHPNLKSKTQFKSLNLTEPQNWNLSKEFDIIFCRNVFIYFSEEDVRKIALQLKGRMATSGLFVSGLSEPLRFPEWNMTPFGPSCYKNTPPEVRIDTVKTSIRETEPYRVLVVDDSTTIQKLMRGVFAKDPACREVVTAGNGREAFDKLRAEKFEIITLDLHMPDVSGIDFLEKFYDRKNHPPVIIVSSVNRTDLDLATRSLQLGAYDYVEKPAMNTLEKSSNEIRTKAHLAMRQKGRAAPTENGGYDKAIGQKVVIPDASQCLRAVVADRSVRPQIEAIVRGQMNEQRSPALIIIETEVGLLAELEAVIDRWTDRKIVRLRGETMLLKPNHIYLCPKENFTEAVAATKAKTLSVQVLTRRNVDFSLSGLAPLVQVLVDESLSNDSEDLGRVLGHKVSDVTPSTSFPSLSAEFFAHLRRIAS